MGYQNGDESRQIARVFSSIVSCDSGGTFRRCSVRYQPPHETPTNGLYYSMKNLKVAFCAVAFFMLIALVAIIATTFRDGEDGTLPCLMILIAGIVLIGFILEDKPCK